MADTHSKEIRSYNMSKIRNSNTTPEIIVRKFLFSRGLRFRKNDKRYPGHPDVILPKYKTAIYINGCFWHMHEGCKYFVIPKSNCEYWFPKLKKNKERDKENQEKMRKMSWNVVEIWECQLKRDIRDLTLNNLYKTIKNETR